MKILILSKSYSPTIGGVETAVRELSTFLSEDHEVRILTVGTTRKGGIEREGRVEVIRLPIVAKVLSTGIPRIDFVEFCQYLRWADLVYNHLPNPVFDLALAFFRGRIRMICHYHFDVTRQKVPLLIYRHILNFALHRAESIIVSSPIMIATSPFLKRFSGKCYAIPFGASVQHIQESHGSKKIQERYSWKKIILFVGRLVPYKGVDVLLHAFSECNDARLIILGDGPREGQLKELSRKLGIASRVDFVPHCSNQELSDYMRACKFLVLPSVSRTESFGLVILEALAFGKPVVSTEIGTGTSFVNKSGITGHVVPPNDPAALSRAMNNLLDDREQYLQFSQNCLTAVATWLSKSKYLQDIEKVLVSNSREDDDAK